MARPRLRRISALADEKSLHRIWILRSRFHPVNVVDAMEFLRDKIAKTDSNAEFIASMSS